MSYLQLKKTNCRNCHKCIRHCPVKSIRFSGNQAYINEEECILCGHCFVICPQNAKKIVDSRAAVKTLLAGDAPVIASVAPSFAANYVGVGIESVRETLKQMGFADAEETAIGATIVKREYDRILDEENRDVIITSCCHSVNLLIQKYYPSLVGCLADVLSPMQAHGQDIKRRIPGAKVVFIGPCISKKDEADRYPGYVDAVITYDDLALMMEEKGLTFKQELGQTDTGKARFFPTNGGVLNSMNKSNPDYTYMSIDGPTNCINALDDIRDGGIHHCFIEMNICQGACVGGPIMEKHQHATVRDYAAVARYVGKKDFKVEQPSKEMLRKKFPVMNRRYVMPDEKQITDALHAMGKYRKSDELNCGTCGYETCRDKAIAICQGKAEVTMCLPYLMARSDSISETIIRTIPNGLIAISESLEVQQINRAALNILGLSSSAEIMGEFVGDFMPSQEIIESMDSFAPIHNKALFIEKTNRTVEETVVYDRDYHVMVCVLRDITAETLEHERKEKQNRQTAEVADKVISHQMRIVQEIAMLLGETAAETKIALTKLKESIDDE